MKSFKQYITEESQPTVYCDLDEVLVDFLGGINKFLDGKKFEDVAYWKKTGINKRAIIDSQTDHAYGGLGWKSDGKKLWNFIEKYKPHILSSYPSSWAPNARSDKFKWIKRNLGNIKANRIHLVKRVDKMKHATTGGQPNLLIDDFHINIKEWKSAGGIGIHHKSTASTISQLKKHGFGS
tara:strand:+ start:1876 stop:2415 length:540 start_codon:yes stop_codon:yes gene_type:complete